MLRQTGWCQISADIAVTIQLLQSKNNRLNSNILTPKGKGKGKGKQGFV